MSDLIKRSEAITEIKEYANNHTFNSFYKGMLKACEILAQLPSADGPQGEWIMSDIQNEADVLNGNYAYVCTNCNHTDIHAKTQKVPYCWWCGARMKGADDVLEGDR